MNAYSGSLLAISQLNRNRPGIHSSTSLLTLDALALVQTNLGTSAWSADKVLLEPSAASGPGNKCHSPWEGSLHRAQPRSPLLLRDTGAARCTRGIGTVFLQESLHTAECATAANLKR